MRKILASLLAIASMSSTYASTYTGPALVLQTGTSPTQANVLRFSVQISGSTGCANSSWYAVEVPDSSAVGKVWVASILSAQARGVNITITGTGTCDVYGVETISYINSLL